MPRNVPNLIHVRFNGDKTLELSMPKIKNTAATNKK